MLGYFGVCLCMFVYVGVCCGNYCCILNKHLLVHCSKSNLLDLDCLT